MAKAATDRNLLFGILALQMDLVNREALVAAMHAWVLEKSTPLGKILVQQKALASDEFELLEALVKKHLQRHGNDAEQSLAAVDAAPVRQQLEQITDPEVQASLFHVRKDPSHSRALHGTTNVHPAGNADAYGTQGVSVGAATSIGTRFRILRPHAKGGLGQVSVAHDSELHREVALKEIQSRHADHPGSRARFLREAEITGALEHPGVVPVYGLGQYADGRPFYAMRFIRGASLKETIDRVYKAERPRSDRGEQALEFRQLLGRFVAVCNAIAFAHSRGVLHRDVKPDNIMLGEFGETLVVDWGLAKQLNRPEAEVATADMRPQVTSTSGSEPTEMGLALGTPSYMSPEQAAGRLDLLTPASDVYSLGATLYCLLTGRAPFRGSDVGVMLQQVQRGEFAPPWELNRQASRALSAICLKAMALKPEERYASARAFADDIEHWLADEPVAAYRDNWSQRLGRWARRHRTFVTATAVTVLVATGILLVATLLLTNANERERRAKDTALLREQEAQNERTEAQKQRDKAESNFKLAELQREKAESHFKLARDAVDRFHTKVSENRLLNEPGLQPLRKELLETAREFYQKFVQERGNDPGVQADLARALVRLASITSEIDSKLKASEICEQALALWEKLVKDNTKVAEYQNALAECHVAAADLYEALGKPEKMAAARQQAVAVRAELLRAEPKNTTLQGDLARNYAELGEMYNHRNEHEKAMAATQQALDILKKRAGDNPQVADFQASVPQVQFLMAGLYHQQRDPAKAEALHQEAVAALEGLIAANPGVTKYQDFLADGYAVLGHLYLRHYVLDKAEKFLLKAVYTRKKVARAHPGKEFQERLAGAYDHVVLLYWIVTLADRNANATAKAEMAYREGLAILEKLASENPAVTRYQEKLALTHYQMGKLYTIIGDTAKSEGVHRQAVAVSEKLVEQNPQVAAFQDKLAGNLQNLGKFYEASNQIAKAEQTHEQAIKVRDKLVKDHPDNPQKLYQGALAGAYDNLGSLYVKTNRWAQAEPVYKKQIAIWQELARDYPTSPSDYQKRVEGTSRILKLIQEKLAEQNPIDPDAALSSRRSDNRLARGREQPRVLSRFPRTIG